MGIKKLKPKQVESITSFVSGKDTFVSLPTGYGNTDFFFCYTVSGLFSVVLLSLHARPFSFFTIQSTLNFGT